MGDWGFLTALLDKVQSHSTVIGKIWMNVLFIFRILVLGAAAESVWRDEHSNLVCNTMQPGCENVCYDWQFPISHIRFWVMQILFVSTPTLVYLVYAVQVFHQENKLRQKIQSLGEGHMLKDHKYTDESGHVKIKVKLESYLTQLFFKIILEIAFIIGQYYLYDFIMIAKFTCFQAPCPYTVECFISRPTEKTIFIIFMLVLACVSLLLNVIEVFYVLCTRLRCRSGNKQAHNITSAKNPASLPSSPGSHGWALRMQNMLFESCQDLSEGLDGVEDERHLLTDH